MPFVCVNQAAQFPQLKRLWQLGNTWLTPEGYPCQNQNQNHVTHPDQEMASLVYDLHACCVVCNIIATGDELVFDILNTDGPSHKTAV
jgi:hypothetical protein